MQKLDKEELENLINRLIGFRQESGWIEFKTNYADPKGIAEYISALGNSAVLNGESMAFMVWGVDDRTYSVVGTDFQPEKTKKGNEDLLPWLRRVIVPTPEIQFQSVVIGHANVVLLRIKATRDSPYRSNGEAFIREGSYNKPLNRFPDLEKRLYRELASYSFERELAKSFLSEDEVLNLIDHDAFFELSEIPTPAERDRKLDHLKKRELISFDAEKAWSITNLGAILYAKDLTNFPDLKKKALRVILYKENDRRSTHKDWELQKGYAAGFKEAYRFIVDSLPAQETISEATGLREDSRLIPPLVIRELLANAFVHQDLSDTRTRLLVEIFQNRVEVLNPGKPLIDPRRFIDSPSVSRNPMLGDELRHVRIVEEKGSGWDKITSEMERHLFPPAEIETADNYTLVVVSGAKPFKEMSNEERVSAVYQHACLNQVNRQDTNNASIRARFGIEEKNKSDASRVLRLAVDAGLIALYDSHVGAKSRRYVPFWAETARRV